MSRKKSNKSAVINERLGLEPQLFNFHLLWGGTCRSMALLLTFIGWGFFAQAQTYPVQVTPVLLPPYTLNTSDYYNGTAEKLAVVLTNTDLQKPVLSVRLRMYIESQNAKLQSRDGVYYPTITLDAGIPQRISLSDLAPYFSADNLNFSGITRSMYTQNGKLPEGFYSFCFEVIEVNTGKVLSRKSCSMAWISLSDPPLLNLPIKGESIASREVQNIIFQWTPRNMGSPNGAFNTEYEFTLKELWDTGIAPEAAFQTTQPLYQATVRQTTLLMGPAEPQLIPGKRYAWRVRAVSTSPTGEQADNYRNNGFSEIYWFTYQSDCRPPLSITSSVTGGRATINWLADATSGGMPAGGYTLQYRERSLSGSKWYSVNTLENRAMLYDLKPGTTYEYRVGSSCSSFPSGEGWDGASYSDLLTLEINGNPKDTVTVNCGMISPEIAINNRTPIQALNQGDLIMAGGFPVKLTKVTGGGSFSGEGYVTIPMLGQVNVKVRFSGIQINTERQLFAGVIETTYDPNEKQITNLDKIIEGGDGTGIVVTGKNYADYEVDFPIKGVDNIRPVFKDKEGNEIPEGSTTPAASATITVSDGVGKTKTIEADKIPTTIKDSEGTIYKVEQGTDGKPKVSKVSESVPMKMTVAELNTLNTDRGTVFFSAHPKQQYAFDEYQAEYAKSTVFGTDVYQKLNDNYFVNAKAILQGKTDLVKATIALKDNSLKADSVQFVTGKGNRLQATLIQGSAGYEISLVGGPANDAQELFAVYPLGNGKYLSLGKLLVSSYQPKTVKVQLVPVNGNTLDKNAITAQLNKTYNPIGVSFNVSETSNFVNTDWDLNKDGKLAVSGSGFLATQTAEMKALNNAYKAANPSVAKDVAVLFMLNSSDSTANLAGDMPRGKQFGYLFSGADGNTAAHEIGHGVFKLEHTFSKYGFTKTDLVGNMMNYPPGEKLTKFQWDAIHAPGIVVGLFEKDEDGMVVVTGTGTYITPIGTQITITGKHEINTLCLRSDFYPNGSLLAFTVNGIEYYADIPYGASAKFWGYKSRKDGKLYVDVNNYIAGKKPTAVIYRENSTNHTVYRAEFDFKTVQKNQDIPNGGLSIADFNKPEKLANTSENQLVSSGCTEEEIEPIISKGKYTAKITFDAKTGKYKVEVKLDPQSKKSPKIKQDAAAFEKQMSDLATEKLNELGKFKGKSLGALTESTDDDGEFYVKNMDGAEWVKTICDLGSNVWENAALPENYWNKDSKEYNGSTIHLPPTLAGVSDGAIDLVSDYPQLVKLNYDVATKEEVRKGIWEAVKNISPSSVISMAESGVKDKIAKYNFSDKSYLGYHEIGKDGVSVVTTIMGAGFISKANDALENGVKKTGEKIRDAIKKKLDDIEKEFLGDAFRELLQAKFKNYKGLLSFEEWTQRYKTLYKNRKIGKLAEDEFELLEGGLKPKKAITTSDGKRYFDNVLDGTAREVKSGPVSLSAYKEQILKDIEILKQDLTEGKIKNIEWHCFDQVDKIKIDELVKQELGNKSNLFKIIQH